MTPEMRGPKSTRRGRRARQDALRLCAKVSGEVLRCVELPVRPLLPRHRRYLRTRGHALPCELSCGS
jgi:hypothetical protein